MHVNQRGDKIINWGRIGNFGSARHCGNSEWPTSRRDRWGWRGNVAKADDADETNGPMIPWDEADLANEAADATEAAEADEAEANVADEAEAN